MEQDETSETLRRVRHRLKGVEVKSSLFENDAPALPARSPSDWFARKFPELALQYGPPMLERVETLLDQDSQEITPVALNEEFFAAVLGGDPELGHRVIYNVPDLTFHFFDPREGVYCETSEQKLVLVLSQYLIRCAAEMPPGVRMEELFGQLREEAELKKVVRRARALLAADDSFFAVGSPNRRLRGLENHGTMARAFARMVLKPRADSSLTVSDCYGVFNEFCQERGLGPLDRRSFRPLITDAVWEEYNLTVRHDVLGANKRQQHGWKGLLASHNGN